MKTIPYSRFKHGQRVTCEIEGKKIDDAKIIIDSDGSIFICHKKKCGFITAAKFGYKYSFCIFADKDGVLNNRVTNLKFLPRTKEKIENNPDWFAPYEEKNQYARSWEEIDKIGGYFVRSDSKICEYGVIDFSIETNESNKNIYATKNQAKSALAEAQLSQLLKQIYDSESWKPVWGGTRTNYCITLFDGVAKISTFSSNAMFLAFPTLKLAYQFLENHRELIEIYFSKYNW